MIRTICFALTLALSVPAAADPAGNIAMSSKFFDSLNAGDMEAWVSTMSRDIVTYEPVGTPGNSGHDGVLTWAAANAAAGFKSVVVEIRAIHPTPAENAVEWTTVFTLQDGSRVALDGVDIHRFNDAGLISEVRAYFDPTPLVAAMSQ